VTETQSRQASSSRHAMSRNWLHPVKYLNGNSARKASSLSRRRDRFRRREFIIFSISRQVRVTASRSVFRYDGAGGCRAFRGSFIDHCVSCSLARPSNELFAVTGSNPYSCTAPFERDTHAETLGPFVSRGEYPSFRGFCASVIAVAIHEDYLTILRKCSHQTKSQEARMCNNDLRSSDS